MNKNLYMKSINNLLFKLPTPINISYWWNFGSMLGMFLIFQIISGFFLSMHYCPNIYYAFKSIIFIIQDTNMGWLFHNIHINGASFYFMSLYFHISRNLYYTSFKLINTWMIGVTIYILSMATAFLGYVLPWGQMSYWGATVITNLISTIPFIGNEMTQWIWGGFSINNATLSRFYSLHFILPFIITTFIMIHLMFLHTTGSTNPLGINSNFYKIPFNNYFTMKDTLGFNIFILIFMFINFQYSYIFSDPDNFSPANPMITPTHIQPEWYFLFAYAILRSIPNKLGGVLALLLSIIILYILPLTTNKLNTSLMYPLNQLLFWMFSNTFIMLTWAGAQLIEFPYINISQMLSTLYFILILSMMISFKMWEKMLKIK